MSEVGGGTELDDSTQLRVIKFLEARLADQDKQRAAAEDQAHRRRVFLVSILALLGIGSLGSLVSVAYFAIQQLTNATVKTYLDDKRMVEVIASISQESIKEANASLRASSQAKEIATVATTAANKAVEESNRVAQVLDNMANSNRNIQQLTDAAGRLGRERNEVVKSLSTNPEFIAAVRSDLSPIPPRAIVFFDRECPTGWNEYRLLRGRYVVGAHEPSKVGRLVGYQLADEENRPTGSHRHFPSERLKNYMVIDNLGDVPGRTSTMLAHGQGVGRYVDNQTGDVSLAQGTKTMEGTNAPYIQLLACVWGASN